ncbi:hypothetical protein R6Q57_017823 [Mikania cordata]
MYSPATVNRPAGFYPVTIFKNPREIRNIKLLHVFSESSSSSSSSCSSNSTLRTSSTSKRIEFQHEASRVRNSCSLIRKFRVSSDDAQPTVSFDEDEVSEPSFLEFITSERVKVVAMVALALALCNADRVVMSVAIVPLSQSRGWSQAFAGVVQSSFLWGYLISPIAGGTLVDYYGGKIVMSCGVALWSMATFLTPWAAESSLWALLSMRALLGVAEGVALPCMNNMIARWFPQTERARAVGLAMAGFQLGSAIGLTLSPILMSQGGVGGPFIIFGLSGFLWVLGFFVILSWMPIYFKTIYHVDLRQAAWFSAVPWSMMALVGYFAGVFSDKLIQSGMTVTLTRKIMQSIGFVGPGVALIGLTMAKNPVVASAWLTLAVGLKAFSHCGFLVNLQEIAPQYSGVLHGMSNTAGTLAAIIGTVGAGFFVELVGSFQGFLLLTALLYFSAALFYNIFSTGERVNFDEDLENLRRFYGWIFKSNSLSSGGFVVVATVVLIGVTVLRSEHLATTAPESDQADLPLELGDT